jgi:hypothetical protein
MFRRRDTIRFRFSRTFSLPRPRSLCCESVPRVVRQTSYDAVRRARTLLKRRNARARFLYTPSTFVSLACG